MTGKSDPGIQSPNPKLSTPPSVQSTQPQLYSIETENSDIGLYFQCTKAESSSL